MEGKTCGTWVVRIDVRQHILFFLDNELVVNIIPHITDDTFIFKKKKQKKFNKIKRRKKIGEMKVETYRTNHQKHAASVTQYVGKCSKGLMVIRL